MTPTDKKSEFIESTSTSETPSTLLQAALWCRESSQEVDHSYQFNNMGFIDDISISAETPEGVQTFPDVVYVLSLPRSLSPSFSLCLSLSLCLCVSLCLSRYYSAVCAVRII